MKTYFAPITAGLLLMMASSANAAGAEVKHGTTLDPIARQTLCYNANDYNNPPNGSGIRNAACRAAYQFGDKQDWERAAMFVERNAYSQVVPDHNHPEAKVPDGLLCAAGHEKYRGMDLPSAEWQSQGLTINPDGIANIDFNASQIHEPSVWKIYLSNATYDSSASSLRWQDLVPLEVVSVDVVPSTRAPGIYHIKVKIPAERYKNAGKAVIYIYWQRTDSGGNEGFFNCSDVTLDPLTDLKK